MKFNKWCKWENRNSINNSDYPGVYILAYNEKNISGKSVNLKAKFIIYFGETTKKTLKKRWKQFENTAFKGKNQHAGGKTYKERIGGPKKYLYVAAFPIIEKSDVSSARIKYIERKLIYEFCKKNKKRPLLNKK